MSSFPRHDDRTPDGRPVPARRRWLKWAGVASVLFVIAFVLLFLAWSRVAGNRLQAAIDRITAAGEPLFPDDFNSPPIPDGDNAAVLYEEAATLVEASGASKSPLLDRCIELEVDDDEFMSTCGALVAEHADALALVREARGRPNVRWSIEYTSPLMDTIFPNLSGARTLGKLLRIKMKIDDLRRQDAEFVQAIEDTLALAAAVDQRPELIAHLIALATEAQALYAIEEFGARLVIRSIDNPAAEDSADPNAVRRLINRMLDDEVLNAGIVRAMQSERAMQLDTVLMVSSGRMTPGVLSGPGPGAQTPGPLLVILTPLFKLDGLAMLDYMSHTVHAVQLPSLPEFREYMNSIPPPPFMRPGNRLQQIQHILSNILFPSLNRAIVLHYRLLSHRRMAAIALAIRMYEIDHGHRPRVLDSLVPDYLPAIPADPMTTNGVIQYLPGAEYPRLYSIGPNGTDDGGEYGYKRSGGINWDVADSPFFLDGLPPSPDEDDADYLP